MYNFARPNRILTLPATGRPVEVEYAGRQWSKLEEAIKAVQRQQAVRYNLEELYRVGSANVRTSTFHCGTHSKEATPDKVMVVDTPY